MIRAVLDTNILVSALITKKNSAPLQLYKAFTAQKFLLITSPSILAEVEDVINRDKIVKYHKLNPKQRETIMEQLLTLCYVTLESVKPDKVIVERDPKDDKFLHAANESHADYIVRGDDDLLDLKENAGIKILSPNEFLAIIENYDVNNQ
jgi:putative PIN family toxin of toxin-antitoxin system